MLSVSIEDRSKDTRIGASWKLEWKDSDPPEYIGTYRTKGKASRGKICVENTGRFWTYCELGPLLQLIYEEVRTD